VEKWAYDFKQEALFEFTQNLVATLKEEAQNKGEAPGFFDNLLTKILDNV